MTDWLAALFILNVVLCLAWMTYLFRVLSAPSLVGLTFLMIGLRYGAAAVWYWQNNPSLPIPIPGSFLYFLGATFLGYTAGATVVASLLQFRLGEAQRHFFSQITVVDARVVRWPVFGAVLVFSVVAAIYYIGGSERTGIEMLVSHSREAVTLRDFRQEVGATNPFSYVGFLAGQVTGPFLLMITIAMWLRTRGLVWAMLALGLVVLIFLAATMSLSKAPIIVVALYVMLAVFVGRWDGGRVRLTHVVAPAGLVLALGSLGYVLTYGKSAAHALEDTVDRLVVVPLVSVHGFLHVYPDLVPFQNGLGIGTIAKLADVSGYVSPSLVVGTVIAGQGVCADSIWSVDLWANFGWPGVILGSAGVGGILAFLEYWCLLQSRTVVSVAVYAFLLGATTRLAEGSIFTMLLSGGLVLVPVLGWFLDRSWHARKTLEPAGAFR
ncbi:MAG: hypothetical protein IT348_17350 [Candidatus Eisenbacteria bacterium]|nr:hypothetical protein [Candidatus Eisenbacteria bacterium]